ncbi:MAG: phospholipase D-like domain-containing protein, partial [Fidelibacterota bacterium]
MNLKFITNYNLYDEVIKRIPKASSFVWIGTADIKDMHVHAGKKVVSFLSILDQLSNNKVAVRLLHAKEPGPNFCNSFDKYPNLIDTIERQMCPRVHFKHIIIDGKLAYSGSANLTGAGLGIKSEYKRNFEAGFITTNQKLVRAIMQQFDDVWMGKFCQKCKRRE